MKDKTVKVSELIEVLRECPQGAIVTTIKLRQDKVYYLLEAHVAKMRGDGTLELLFGSRTDKLFGQTKDDLHLE